ncbi:hypothetical protein GJ496_000601 [Pomphorhynchus laevis]|nr:hypothetical protein GJ496_000601 [Pomphorhynchus laevis]
MQMRYNNSSNKTIPNEYEESVISNIGFCDYTKEPQIHPHMSISTEKVSNDQTNTTYLGCVGRHIEHTIRSESNGVCYSPLSGFVPSTSGLSAPSPKSSIPTYEAVKNSTFGKDIPSNYVNHITSHSQQYQHKITNRSVARFVTYNKRRPKFASPRR